MGVGHSNAYKELFSFEWNFHHGGPRKFLYFLPLMKDVQSERIYANRNFESFSILNDIVVFTEAHLFNSKADGYLLLLRTIRHHTFLYVWHGRESWIQLLQAIVLGEPSKTDYNYRRIMSEMISKTIIFFTNCDSPKETNVVAFVAQNFPKNFKS